MALQGYTKIELTDVETNNTEVYEKHNIVTNALSEIFRPIGYWKTCDTMLNRTSPWVSELCGGMLCFDKSIPEDKNTLFAPAGTTLIACGAYNQVNATSNTIRGDSNKLESVIDSTNRTAKFVYDFKTTQGNGTISSICLTSNKGGYRSYNVPSGADSGSENLSDYSIYKLGSVYPSVDYNSATWHSSCKNKEIPFLIDSENGIKYSILYDTIDYIKIIKRSMYTKTMNIFDSSINDSYSKLINQTQLKLNIGRLCGIWTWWSSDEQSLYLFYGKSSSDVYSDYYISNGKTLGIIKLNYPDWSVEYLELVNPTDTKIDMQRCCVYKENLYFIQPDNPAHMFQINIKDSSNYLEFSEISLSSYAVPIDVLNGKILYFSLNPYSYSSTYSTYILDTTLERISSLDGSISSSYAVFIPILNDKFHYYFNRNLIIPSQYLATINNLETPIAKTSDKTMKITYTLKEVDS